MLAKIVHHCYREHLGLSSEAHKRIQPEYQKTAVTGSSTVSQDCKVSEAKGIVPYHSENHHILSLCKQTHQFSPTSYKHHVSLVPGITKYHVTMRWSKISEWHTGQQIDNGKKRANQRVARKVRAARLNETIHTASGTTCETLARDTNERFSERHSG
jgi:hypothetical protein